jgi:3-phenylpropionate/trans-cinnamate dioxygenase ferredoxin component
MGGHNIPCRLGLHPRNLSAFPDDEAGACAIHHERSRFPARAPSTMSEAVFRRVLAAAELPEGQMRAVDIGARNVLVCHTRDGWFAVDGICTHAYAKMDQGRLRGHRLNCPLHGASFDCRTGAVLDAPATLPLKTYPIRCVADDVEVAV